MDRYEWEKELRKYVKVSAASEFWCNLVKLHIEHLDGFGGEYKEYPESMYSELVYPRENGYTSKVICNENGLISYPNHKGYFEITKDTIMYIDPTNGVDNIRLSYTTFENIFRNLVDPRRDLFDDFIQERSK